MKHLVSGLVLIVIMSVFGQANADPINDMIFNYKRLGYLTDIKCSWNKAMVEPFYWNNLTYNQKQNSATVMASYCKTRGGAGAIRIHNTMDGKELGELTAWGFYVK